MTPPGQMGGGRTTADYARDSIAASRGQFGREFAELRRMSGRDRAAAFRQMTEQHRLNALQIAQMARRGPLPANAGGRIREALEADLAAWREAFQVGRRDWQATRDQWLLDRDSLTAEQWALQRANWFAARDAWIAQQIQRAQARGQ